MNNKMDHKLIKSYVNLVMTWLLLVYITASTISVLESKAVELKQRGASYMLPLMIEYQRVNGTFSYF